jgi:hypothetical protein
MIPPPFFVPLQFVVGSSFQETVTIFSLALAQLGLVGATAELVVRATPSDPAPLFTVSTTPSASGSLTLGVTFPRPGGVAAAGVGALQQFGPGSTATTDLPPITASVADLTALALLATGSYGIGVCAFVQAGAGSYFLWSPSDPSTPNGTTVVAGSGGNWLLAGTVVINLTATATSVLVGFDSVRLDLIATLADGSVVPLIEALVPVRPTIA